MPKPRLDDLYVKARRNEQRGEVVPQVVEPEVARQACRLAVGADGALDRPRAADGAPFVGHEGLAVADAGGFDEKARHLLGNRNGIPARVGLEWLVPPLDRGRDDSGGEVDVLDPKCRHLGEPEPCVCAEQNSGLSNVLETSRPALST